MACPVAYGVSSVVKSQTCGTTNIAQGKSVVVSTQWEYRQGPGAVDGNLGWGWYTTGTADTNFIYVDLAQSYTICKTKIYWENDGMGKNYLIQTSTDAVNWTTIATRTNNTAFVDSFNVIGTGRYVRLYLTAKINSWSSYALAEIEIYNTLSNFKPTVTLTAPVNNTKTIAGTNLKLTATASDADGSISKVAFYQDSIKIGESITPPYQYTITNIQPGSYVFKARAYDNTNADTLSAGVQVLVNPSNRWSLSGNSGTNPDSNFVGTLDDKKLVFKVNNSKKMTILSNGFVGIGIDALSDPDAKLGVNGTIYGKKLKITQSGWADYVFEKDYQLMKLRELEAFINSNKHLPGMPTTKEVQKRALM